MCNRKIKELERRIEWLEQESNIYLHIPFTHGWKPQAVRTKTVVERILDHLGLEIEYMPATPEYAKLKKAAEPTPKKRAKNAH